MTCIVKIENNEPTGWITGKDINDCLLQLNTELDEDERLFYEKTKDKNFKRGKYEIMEGYWLLVD